MFRKASTMIKDWDLNIYFVEEDDNVYSDTLRINPVLWTMDNGLSDVTYSNWFIDTNFAETRYLRSQYPENDYGMDWTDTLEGFLEKAPPRLRQALLSLPSAETVEPKDVLDLVVMY